MEENMVIGMENPMMPVAGSETRCIVCNQLLREDKPFCPACGTIQKKLCTNCGTELKDTQTFCNNCGQRVGGGDVEVNPAIEKFNQEIIKKQSSSRAKIVLWAGIAFSIIVAIVLIFSAWQKQRVEEYKKNAKTFCSEVLAAAANLETIGNEIENEWYDYIYDRWSIYDSVDEAVAGAQYNMSDEIAKAKRQKGNIDRLYAKIKKPVNNSDEMEDLCDAAEAFYEAYEDMYDCVIDPSGNYNTFKAEFSEYDSDAVDAYENMKSLCDDLD